MYSAAREGAAASSFCGGCNQVGYCDEVPPGQKPCHKAHWKAGHKQECQRFQAEAKAAAEAAGGDGSAGGMSGGDAGEGAAGGGDGGEGQKKKRGGGKKKKGRRKD